MNGFLAIYAAGAFICLAKTFAAFYSLNRTAGAVQVVDAICWLFATIILAAAYFGVGKF